MDRLIEAHGEDGALALVMTRVAEGEDPRDIARSQGMPWMVMRRWLEDRDVRMREWELAKRCFADGLAYESLREVRDAGLEEVPLARLRSESYVKMAAKMSRVEWGEQKQGMVIEGMTMDQALGGFASALLEKMQVVSVQVGQTERESQDKERAGNEPENDAENEAEKFSAQKFLEEVEEVEEVVEVCDAE